MFGHRLPLEPAHGARLLARALRNLGGAATATDDGDDADGLVVASHLASTFSPDADGDLLITLTHYLNVPGGHIYHMRCMGSTYARALVLSRGGEVTMWELPPWATDTGGLYAIHE